MTDPSPLRVLVGALEKELTPPLQRMFGSGEFAGLVAGAAKAESAVRTMTGATAARLWHLVNLPTGTDVQRVRVLVAELDGEVRRLQRQIDQHDEELHHDNANVARGSAES